MALLYLPRQRYHYSDTVVPRLVSVARCQVSRGCVTHLIVGVIYCIKQGKDYLVLYPCNCELVFCAANAMRC